ncbi:hypothetical protein L1987_82212 [Smallanthus sonchifolius]|uniref:Uncharacterized protein n=1 Tax=Smallanthus sonchifolius TaxID=185202 RepID=A0ACB8YAA1_9ASTR|nr:hypothetical protein L1987_82212 [Smallanthus sonchifolius]
MMVSLSLVYFWSNIYVECAMKLLDVFLVILHETLWLWNDTGLIKSEKLHVKKPKKEIQNKLGFIDSKSPPISTTATIVIFSNRTAKSISCADSG